ncbi:tRNA lysidine(34) synthetase TilS [Microbacterium sp. STN6]|uniref:tRNA lysidine(34) synthetase TilS n=1 Tax=Microbacterium sp. STN6 TaxID=2995588 RepID=UPI0022610338|nr:tRNA lysidine(34) synthetase TilS [Microbacterium sp. STN6]MCX7523055.1 tRNA lysidine(34) synthetase TilS [Microbacterium sp. STN6]
MASEHGATRRPRLTPAIADVRRAVRSVLEADSVRAGSADSELVLVGLSGGADSLALAAATAFEAPRAGLRAGAIIVDHGLQPNSADVAAAAAAQARALGLDPVMVKTVTVGGGFETGAGAPSSTCAGDRGFETGAGAPSSTRTRGGGFETGAGAPSSTRTRGGGFETGAGAPSSTRGGGGGGPEAAARDARYGAFREALAQTGASRILLAHTLDDQAETVLLGLARGSGATSLSGMAPQNGPYVRPLLGIRRETTRAFCRDCGLEPWEDPHNSNHAFARVRVRESVLPTLERELGPGIADALARTAEQLREDSEALDAMIVETIEDICEPAEAGIAVLVGALAANPAALRGRIIRYVVHSEFGVSLHRSHTLAALRLVTDWHGQGALDLPGVRVVRQGSRLIFTRA